MMYFTNKNKPPQLTNEPPQLTNEPPQLTNEPPQLTNEPRKYEPPLLNQWATTAHYNYLLI